MKNELPEKQSLKRLDFRGIFENPAAQKIGFLTVEAENGRKTAVFRDGRGVNALARSFGADELSVEIKAIYTSARRGVDRDLFQIGRQ